MKKILLIHQNFWRNPYYNLAIEESIAINLVESEFIAALRIWKNQNTTVLGISDKIEKNIPAAILENFKTLFPKITANKKIIPEISYVVRRASGGGTVLHTEKSNLNYSIFVSLQDQPNLYDVKKSYTLLLGLVIGALKKQNIDSAMAGKSDLSILENSLEKKISGNAQFRKKDCVVQHGTLILDLSILEKVTELLSHPPEEPEYRKNRTHRDFLTCLPKEFSEKIFASDLKFNLVEFLNAKSVSENRNLKFWKKILTDANRLYTEKYATLEFICSR